MLLDVYYCYRALYEQMFRAEPRKHVSRPTFMTVMRRVYGFNTAPLAGQVDQAALHKLGEVRYGGLKSWQLFPMAWGLVVVEAST